MTYYPEQPYVPQEEEESETRDNDGYIPELELTPEAIEQDFGVGELSDGSIDEMERQDTDDVLAVDDDFSDVLEVGDLNEDTTPKPRPMRFKRTARPYRPMPPSSMGGLRL